jgi:hypothetical protein
VRVNEGQGARSGPLLGVCLSVLMGKHPMGLFLCQNPRITLALAIALTNHVCLCNILPEADRQLLLLVTIYDEPFRMLHMYIRELK